MKGFRAVVRGRVQGVGFRAETEETARALGLAGWVRNMPDGAVEVDAEGPESALRELEQFLRRGPRMAHVTGADFFWHEEADAGAGRRTGFEIR